MQLLDCVLLTHFAQQQTPQTRRQDTYDMQSTQHSPATAALSTTNVVEQIEQIRRAIEESNTETAERQVARPLTTARDADRAGWIASPKGRNS